MINDYKAQIKQHLEDISILLEKIDTKQVSKPKTKKKDETIVVAGIEWYVDFLSPKSEDTLGAFYFAKTGLWYFNQNAGISEALHQKRKLPTSDDFNQLNSLTTRKWLKRGNLYGMLFTDKDNGNEIFFPAAGYRHPTTGALTNVGTEGVYWSSSINSATLGLYLHFYAGYVWPQYYNLRVHELTIRCIKK